jgi:hypothetical protein
MNSTGVSEKPSWAISLSPKIIDSTAASDKPALSRSGLPAFGSLYSGSSSGPTISSSAITGTAIRNTDPHQKYSSNRPPTSGPSAPPTE